MFKVLDSNDCKVEDLKLYSDPGALVETKELVQSNQRHCMQKRQLEPVHPLHQVSPKDSKLLTLSLHYTLHAQETPALRKLLRQCSDSLKAFLLDNVTVEIDADDDFQLLLTGLSSYYSRKVSIIMICTWVMITWFIVS
ncbi:hypothetical protein K501DRAFT_274755 [Backusella circina FSU 941]|nr:hypothetical protein K501DRAFT_274755 [Backusella circina FSU 941]